MKVLLLFLFHILATILSAPLWLDPLNIGSQLGLWDEVDISLFLYFNILILWDEVAQEAVVVETAVAGVIAEGIVQAGGLA